MNCSKYDIMLNHDFFLKFNPYLCLPNLNPHYHFVHYWYHFLGLTRHTTLSEINLFSKFSWFEFFEIRECQQYNSYLETGEKISAKRYMVRPLSLGPHYYLTCFSRIYAWWKKNNLSKCPWYDFLARKECQHYFGYLGAGEKIFAKYCMVRPQYRGAHLYLTRFSPIYVSSKKNNFPKFLWYDFLAREECQHYIGYLGAGEKNFEKYCMVPPQYRGAHLYLTRINPIFASLKKNNFSKFLWYVILARKECQHYTVYLGAGKKNFGKYCMVPTVPWRAFLFDPY